MRELPIELDFTMLKKILNQLIIADGMEVTHQYLIAQHIYYVDNASLIEDLETLIVEQYYEQLYREHGNVDYDILLQNYNPQYINYDKLYNRLEKEHKETPVMEEHKKADTTLNKYLL